MKEREKKIDIKAHNRNRRLARWKRLIRIGLDLHIFLIIQNISLGEPKTCAISVRRRLSKQIEQKAASRNVG